MPNINDILQQRGAAVDKMRNMLDKAESENRDLNEAEQAEYNNWDNEQISCQTRAKRAEAQAALDASIDAVVTDPVRIQPQEDGKVVAKFAQPAYLNAFDQYARQGNAAMMPNVLNALQVGTDSEGGYIVPEEFETTLTKELLDINEFRSLVNVISTASDRNIPIETGTGTATWTAEEAAYSESDAAFGTAVLQAHKLGTIIKVSEELLQDSSFDLQSYLASNFADRFGTAEETAIVTGNGTAKPTGLTVGASAGVTAASATAIATDELIDLYHALARPYRAGASWIMNDSTAKLIRKLKDADGQYIWQPGLQLGMPDVLLGNRVVSSVAMPTAATGNVSVLFGDLKYYTMAERTGRVFQRLNELYAANGQVGFRMFERLDGKVILSAAIKKLTQL